MTITGPDPLTAARPDEPAAKTRRLRLSGGGFWAALWGSRSGKIGVILVGITLLGALVSILGLSPYDPQYQDPTANLGAPSLDHPFGTDNFGRDLFSLVLDGIVVSLEIAVLATLIAGVFGSIGGIVAGYLGGTVIIEQIFILPGLGRLLVTAINERDFPVVQSVTMLFATAFVLVNLGVDVICALIDPRSRDR